MGHVGKKKKKPRNSLLESIYVLKFRYTALPNIIKRDTVSKLEFVK